MTLRIQRSTEHKRVVFTLMGRIRAEQVPGLLKLLQAESRATEVVFDLEQVKLVDRDAVRFLALSEALGGELRNCSGYIRKWINQERNIGPSGSEGSAGSEG